LLSKHEEVYMTNIDFDACYAALQLNFGASLNDVQNAWRKLSRIHHPDQHTTNPRAHKQALEKQKQINNARDVLKKWFEQNPDVPPPRTSTSGFQSGAKSESTKNTSNPNNSSGHSTSSRGSSRQSQKGGSQSSTSNKYREKQTSSGTEGGNFADWFQSSELRLTPLQKLVRALSSDEKHGNGDQLALMQIGAIIGAIFAPMWMLVSLLRALFPETPSALPDGLQLLVLCASGYISSYLFRWFFAEAEILKLQEKPVYLRAADSTAAAIEQFKAILSKHKACCAEWKFYAAGETHEAVLEYEEQLAPELKPKRQLSIRFAAKAAVHGSVVAMQIKVASPINSFSCTSLTKSIISALKAQFKDMAA